MSRSKRAPIYTQGYGGTYRKVAKKNAKKAARAAEDVASGGAYKKAYSSWDICDFKFKAPPTDKKAGRK